MAELCSPTKLAYFDDMWTVQSHARFIALAEGENGRQAVVVDCTIFHPQGGGQPADTGFISDPTGTDPRFVVQDVRIKDGVVYHYGHFEGSEDGHKSAFEQGHEVNLHVDSERRNLNSRLHSAGHLLDICMRKVGLPHLEPGKGYHFPDGPFVEYKGVVPPEKLEVKQKDLENAAKTLISTGGKVRAAVLPYEEASEWCGGSLPTYIPKGSTPRIVKLGDNPGCPCGGTHVSDIGDIRSLKVKQIRTKRGTTKVSYDIVP